jgi:hypothetical protein
MTIATELHANADPTCIHCKGEGFIVCEGDNAVPYHVVCNCVSGEIALEVGDLLSAINLPEAGEEICVAQTVMLTNPDYISDELPTWENDSADFNPISLLFGDRD